MTVLFMRRGLGVVGSSNFSDPTNERLILFSAAGLVLAGVALLVGTIIWWRRGRQEHPALAPLEVMGSRSWAKAPEGDRRRRLERVRVGGSKPTPDEPVRPEPVDLEALVRSVPQAFDDLREPGELADKVEPESGPPNGAVVPAVVTDPDATSLSTERPLVLPATPDFGDDADALASSHGDPS